MGRTFTKDPDAILDYTIDWATWLDDDTISTSIWTAAAGIDIEDVSGTATTATAWLSGGTAGDSYEVVNHVITAAGREDDRTIVVRVTER